MTPSHKLLGVPTGEAKLVRAFLSFRSITIPTFVIQQETQKVYAYTIHTAIF